MKKHERLEKAAYKHRLAVDKLVHSSFPEDVFAAGALWATRAIRREIGRSTFDPCTIDEMKRMVDFALGTGEGRE